MHVNKTPAFIQAVLIDPFQEALHLVQLSRPTQIYLREMYKFLDCEMVQAVPFRLPGRTIHQCWCDESGLLREPFNYPQFLLVPYSVEWPITGYGLITGQHYSAIADCTLSIPDLAGVIRFEPWRDRINPDLVIDQLLRIYPARA